MTRERTRNLQLDVLRAVAILLVFGRHLDVTRPGGAAGVAAETWYRMGWLGVDLFFVLSGFLIGGLLLSELQRHGRIDVLRFLIRRGMKLYPGYFVFIAYLMFAPTLKAAVRGNGPWVTFTEMWAQLWPNLLFLQNYLWSPAGHTWSLSVEEHFYFLLPFGLVALAARNRIRLLAPLCLAAVPLFLLLRCLSIVTGDRFAETMSATHLRLDALLFGVALRGVAQYSPALFQAARKWRAGLVSVAILLWLPNCFLAPDTVLIRTIGLTGTFLGAAALLVAAYHTHAADFGRLRSWAVPVASLLGWVGVHSYAIYLWHVTVIGILEKQVAGRLPAWFSGTQLGWLVTVLVVCSGAILAGAAASRVVEWPVLRLRDRMFPSRSGSLPLRIATHEDSARATSPGHERAGDGGERATDPRSSQPALGAP